MAGLEYGPAKKKVSTFRGDAVQRNGRKPSNGVACLRLFGRVGDEQNSKSRRDYEIPVLFALTSSAG
ncbi:hypothetical protein [Mesorhizobium sp.]|uniref:hypothetical protein n=1 Tax=Mesorhizobium sp. TaxID=1871066 RepID=UPI000FE63DDE|nr:hypothetical protein [Mesorhizobium sp.]RWO55615.1 MAG: hypothetical protein EOS13_00560 [Mesorhizobium sp.]